MATTMDATPRTAAESEEGQSSSLREDSNHVAQDARFSCNICFDAVTEPVVTRCGHLYCWPCLYKWLAPGMTPPERTSLGLPRVLRRPLDESRRVCPVCKSECSVPTVVPIYVRNDPVPKAPPSRPEQSQEEEELQPPQAVHVPTSNNFAPIDDHPNDDDNNSNMGLDIDDDDLDDNQDLGLDIDDNQQHVIPTTVTTTDNGTSLGLRQRRRNESRDELNTALVPTRPVPSRDRAATSDTNISSSAVAVPATNTNTGPTPNHHARATLSYGLVLAMHQTLLNATSDATPDTTAATESIPSIHYPRPRSPAESDTANVWDQEDPASTVFLSRLLLGLSLFVLFCLLSF